jgi:Na+/H+ antiporter NhaD/arsenite permease-like protein
VGNPVGVLIALRADLTFVDFLRWATPIAIIGLAIAVPISLKYFSKEIKQLGAAMIAQSTASDRQRGSAASVAVVEQMVGPPKKPSYYLIPWILFIATIGGLVSHSIVENTFGLEKNTMLLGTAFAAAGATLFLQRDKARELVERRVDWWTLAFFVFLFGAVGTLQLSGVTTLIANGVLELSGGDETRLFFVFSTVSGIAGALMDNILAVATFIPIVNDIGELGIYNYPLWWGLLFAATFFSNMTLIGSTANIVALGMLERQKRGHITLLEWIKPGVLVSIPTLAVALILTYIQIPLMPR